MEGELTKNMHERTSDAIFVCGGSSPLLDGAKL